MTNSYDDGYRERRVGGRGDKGTSWEDWGLVMNQALNPPRTNITDVYRSSVLTNPYLKEQVELYARLLEAQINGEASNWGYRQELIQEQRDQLDEILELTKEQEDNKACLLYTSPSPRDS